MSAKKTTVADAINAAKEIAYKSAYRPSEIRTQQFTKTTSAASSGSARKKSSR